MTSFVQNQIGKLFRFIGVSIGIAYIIVWIVGAIVEFVLHNRILSPIWLIEMFW